MLLLSKRRWSESKSLYEYGTAQPRVEEGNYIRECRNRIIGEF